MNTPMDWGAARFWLDMAQWAFMGLVAIWAYLRTKDTDNTRAIKEVAVKLDNHMETSREANDMQNARLVALESTLKHMPSQEEIGDLREAVAATKAQVEGMAHSLTRVEHQTNLIHEHLLRSKV